MKVRKVSSEAEEPGRSDCDVIKDKRQEIPMYKIIVSNLPIIRPEDRQEKDNDKLNNDPQSL